ncbi:hypothetical protein CALVIDRAFT_100137 [Calocera viscosa TUFC12733]|uniref:Uncharacterized protein n=1 Tax=Calocera viscosa (strain TUFC12733) TaxID=1330018 RepID=A0A167MKN0_CALVF|nr:hypothetical protein CALVIDRAFT_100137 [Calocera viscosa TUFC12733]
MKLPRPLCPSSMGASSSALTTRTAPLVHTGTGVSMSPCPVCYKQIRSFDTDVGSKQWNAGPNDGYITSILVARAMIWPWDAIRHPVLSAFRDLRSTVLHPACWRGIQRFSLFYVQDDCSLILLGPELLRRRLSWAVLRTFCRWAEPWS